MSGLDGLNSKDYSKYDGMSTEFLEELLRLDAELSNGEGFDIDEILYISEVIAKREKEHPTGRYAGVDVGAAWETFQTKYLPYMTDGRSLYDFDDDESNCTKVANSVSDISSSSNKKFITLRGRQRLRQVVALAAVIAVLLGLMTVTAYAMGYDLWGVVVRWTKDTFTLVSSSEDDNAAESDDRIITNNREYKDLQAALDAYEIVEPLAPTWIPEGFAIESVSVDDDSDPTIIAFHTSYRCENQWLVIQINMHRDSNNVLYTYWEKDDIDVATLEIENHTFYVTENAGRQCAIWSSGPFECSIISDLSFEELNDVIKSIFVRNE